MKKMIGVFCLLLVLAMLAVPALAVNGSVSLSASSNSLDRGDTFTVSAKLNCSDAIALGTVVLNYDSSVFELTGGSCNVSGASIGQVIPASNVGTFMFSGNPQVVSGTIFTFNMKVKDNAPVGSHTISSSSSIGVGTGESITSGSVTVEIVCKHTYGAWTNAGQNHTQTCSKCGAVKSEDHKWNRGTVTQQPTCSAEGVKTYTCTVCDATKTEPVAATGKHVLGNLTAVDDVNHKDSCANCDYYVLKAHTWNRGTVTQQPTCSAEGVKTFTCTGCSHTKTEPVAATGKHTFGNLTPVDDENHKDTCSTCDQTVVQPHTWNKGTVTQQPTCSAEGVKTLTCTGCKHTKTEPVPATGKHIFGNLTPVDDENHKDTCSTCDQTITQPHTWNKGTVTQKPTCSTEGVKTLTCTGCKHTKTEPVPATGNHTFGNLTPVDDENHKDTCSVCNQAITQPHTWNKGVVTQKPTCSTEGVKTLTCTGCKHTKTEPVPATGNHTFGNLIPVDDENHNDTCSVCNQAITQPHTWNKGVVTQKPTCSTEGVKTFTCTGCKHTKTEPVPATGNHTWSKWQNVDEASHKRTCTVCELEETGEHTYKESWSKDRTNHYHECSACKAQKDVEAHIPGPEATNHTPQTCTVCNYVIKPALIHNHNYSEEWTNDETGHWHTCSGCQEKGEYAEHDFDNACDPDCNTCGYTRETAHSYSEDWASDSENHYHACTVCGDMQDQEAHNPGAAATEEAAQVCTVCGYEIAPKLEAEVTEPADTDVTEPNDNNESSGSNGLVLGIAAAAVVVLAIIVIVVVVVIKKKK